MSQTIPSPIDLGQRLGRLMSLSSSLLAQVRRGDGDHDAARDAASRALELHLAEEEAILEQLGAALAEGRVEIEGIVGKHRPLRQLIDRLGPLVQLHVASLGLLYEIMTALRDPLEVTDPEPTDAALSPLPGTGVARDGHPTHLWRGH